MVWRGTCVPKRVATLMFGLVAVGAGCRRPAQKPLSMTRPVAIEQMDVYHDGGTTYVCLRDARDKLLVFCFDYRAHSLTRGRIYLHAQHPTHRRAKLATREEEAKVIREIQAWLDSHFTADQQEALLKRGSVVGLSRSEKYAFWLLRALRWRERRPQNRCPVLRGGWRDGQPRRAEEDGSCGAYRIS